MKKDELFSNFASVMETEFLDQTQMDSLQGGAKCEAACKKGCTLGRQNSSKGENVSTKDEPAAPELKSC